MFYPTDRPHGLPHNPFNALVAPRPIGWISTLDAEGRPNLAPYSFFNAVAYTPPQVMFSATGRHAQDGTLKDSVENIRATGEFVVNIATWSLREQMNQCSAPAPHGVSEFELAGLSQAPAQLVGAPRVAQSPAHLECRLTRIVELEGDSDTPNTAVFGRVVGIHIDDSVIRDGLIDYAVLQPIGRLGYMDYVRVDETFSMQRPRYPASGR